MADVSNVGDGAVPEPQETVSPSIDEQARQLLTELGGKYAALERELRGLQGRQDKAENAFKKQFAEYESLIKKGLSHDEAVEALENKQKETSLLAELQKRVEDLAKRVEGNGSAKSASQEVVQAFADLGLDTRDPAVIVEMQKYNNVEEAVAGAYKLKKSLSQAPKPLPSQAPAAPVAPTPTANVEALQNELYALSKTPTKPGAMQRIIEIQEALKKAGA